MVEPFLGMIQYYGCNFAPYGFAICDGSILPINAYTALFSLLGTAYGGNGTSNFGLPDLRGRSMTGIATVNDIGTPAGHDSGTTLTLNTMANHTHAANLQIAASNVTAAPATLPGGNVPAVASGRGTNVYNNTGATSGVLLGAPGAMTIVPAGTASPAAFETLAPYLTLTCTIAMQGIFPTRS